MGQKQSGDAVTVYGGSDGAPREAHFPQLDPEATSRATIAMSEVGAADGSGNAKLNEILDREGFAIVTGVLTEAECIEAEAKFAADLRGLIDEASSKFPPLTKDVLEELRDDPLRKWPTNDVPLGRLFATDFGLPCGTFAMFTRLHPNVRRVYLAAHCDEVQSEEELCCGLDTVFFRPPQPMQLATRASDGSGNDDQKSEDAASQPVERVWPHVDVNCCIADSGSWRIFQSALYVWSSEGEEASTTVVWPGSNRDVFESVIRPHTEQNYAGSVNHYVPLPRSHHAEFLEKARRVPIPRGALFIWNSRTVHQGWSLGPRLAQTICYEPRSRRTAGALSRKVKCVMQGRLTTHWASLANVHGAGVDSNGGESTLFNDSGIAISHNAHRSFVIYNDEGVAVDVVDDVKKWL